MPRTLQRNHTMPLNCDVLRTLPYCRYVLHDPARHLNIDLAAVRQQAYLLGILKAASAEGKWHAFMAKPNRFYEGILLRQEVQPWSAGTNTVEGWHSYLWRFYGSAGRRSLQAAESRVKAAAGAWNQTVAAQVLLPHLRALPVADVAVLPVNYRCLTSMLGVCGRVWRRGRRGQLQRGGARCCEEATSDEACMSSERPSVSMLCVAWLRAGYA